MPVIYKSEPVIKTALKGVRYDYSALSTRTAFNFNQLAKVHFIIKASCVQYIDLIFDEPFCCNMFWDIWTLESFTRHKWNFPSAFSTTQNGRLIRSLPWQQQNIVNSKDLSKKIHSRHCKVIFQNKVLKYLIQIVSKSCI